jgi:hypothetical protein
MHREREIIIDNFYEDNIDLNNKFLRNIILGVYNYICPFTNKNLSISNFHLDHFIPKSLIPINKHKSLDNLIPTFKNYNQSKSNIFDDLDKFPEILSL